MAEKVRADLKNIMVANIVTCLFGLMNGLGVEGELSLSRG